MSQRIQWGIIGTGNIAKTFAGALEESTTGQLYAVASRRQASADAFGKEFNASQCYPSYESMLADPKVQAVYISLPNHLHCEWAVKCAQAGKHILCEKPLATNFAQAMTIIEAAEAHGVFLMEAFMYRTHPVTARIAEIVCEGTIGEVRLIESHFGYNAGKPNPENIRWQNDAAGGSLMDLGCYTLSMARLVAGAANGLEGPAEPISLKGQGCIDPGHRVDDWATATLKFPGNVLANISCSHLAKLGATTVITGSKGSLTTEGSWFPKKGDNTLLLEVNGKGQEEVHVESELSLYANEVDIVAAHLGNQQAPSPCMTWADSLGQQKALDQWRAEIGLVYESLEAGKALDRPAHGQPLKRRENAQLPTGQIPGIDKPVSRAVIGTMVANIENLPYTFALLDHFYECGGNAIDTAFVYGGGKSEPAVGQWIKRRGIRDELVLMGKGGHSPNCYPEAITRELKATLANLQTDHLDLYMLHRDNLELPVSELVDCLAEHQKAGRFKAYGVSNWTIARIEEANAYAQKKGLPGIAANSANFALAQWNQPMWPDCVAASDPKSKAWHEKTQMPLLAWSSQASGMFTGRFSREDWDKLDSDHPVVQTWFNEDNFKRLDRARELAKQKGVDSTQVALAYVLSQPLNIFALIGTQTLLETTSSLAGVRLKLTPEELAWLNLENDAVPAGA